MTTIPRYPIYTEEAQPHIRYRGEACIHIVIATVSLQNFHTSTQSTNTACALSLLVSSEVRAIPM